MAKQVINIGSAPNDGTGDSARNAGSKINANFTELYDGLDAVVGGISWDTIADKPTFATVATSGAYTDLTGLPTLGSAAAQDGYVAPAGGAINQVLSKVSADDGDFEWVDQTGGGGIADIVSDTTPQLGGNLDLNSFTVGDASAADLTKLSELTATSIELNYVDGVTSAIQTQLDALVTADGTKVASSLYDANSILAATTDNTPAAVTVAEGTIVGRAAGGNIDDLSATQVRTILNVEDGSEANQTAAEIMTAIEGEAVGDLRAFVNAIQGLVRASGATFATGDLPIAISTDGEFEGETPVVEVRATASDLTTGTSSIAPVYPDSLGDVATPTATASTAGAITLDFDGIVTRTTALTEDITAVTINNLTEHVRAVWELTGHATNNYTITWPTGGVVRAPATTLVVNANEAYIVSIALRGSVYWITWSNSLDLIA